MKISVITPSLNSSEYIEQAIQSVLDQEYPRVEHIFVDGGSQDDTLEILEKYEHLKWISEPDKGQSDAMNKGFRMSNGDVIVYLNSDDYFLPGAFDSIANVFEENRDISFCVGQCKIIGHNNWECINDSQTSYLNMLKWWEDNAYPYNSGSYFYRRHVQEAVGGFDVKKNHSLDYCFLLRCRQKFEFYKINRIINCFRLIPGTKTFDTQGKEYYPEKFNFVNTYLNQLADNEIKDVKNSFVSIFGKNNPLYHHYFNQTQQKT